MIIKWEVYLIAFIMTLTAGIGIGWHEKAIRVPSLLEKQKQADISECQSIETLTKETNDGIQTDRKAVDNKLDALQLQQPSACVPLTVSTQLPETGKRYAGPNGINATALRKYAAECEIYRREINSCTNFLTKEREGINP